MDPQRVSKWLCIAAALMLCILLLYNAATVPSFKAGKALKDAVAGK